MRAKIAKQIIGWVREAERGYFWHDIHQSMDLPDWVMAHIRDNNRCLTEPIEEQIVKPIAAKISGDPNFWIDLG